MKENTMSDTVKLYGLPQGRRRTFEREFNSAKETLKYASRYYWLGSEFPETPVALRQILRENFLGALVGCYNVACHMTSENKIETGEFTFPAYWRAGDSMDGVEALFRQLDEIHYALASDYVMDSRPEVQQPAILMMRKAQGDLLSVIERFTKKEA
jgi:hypothetical protein